jgi:hypothetical protein
MSGGNNTFTSYTTGLRPWLVLRRVGRFPASPPAKHPKRGSCETYEELSAARKKVTER